jgi:hypothetical protein
MFLIPASLWADGFDLKWERENRLHLVMQLSPDQVLAVGRERKLTLTERQRGTLAKFTKQVPNVLGVESLGEPDCSCHVSSALWTAPSEVTIWIERLQKDTDGSKMYYEIRSKPGYYTANTKGEIFNAGKPVSWSAFEAALLSKGEQEVVKLSLPPAAPKSFTDRVQKLRARKPFNERL